MKKSMQLKSRIKEMAVKNQIPAQAVLQNFMLERLLERISVSKYRDIIILKGGMLIASMIGIGSRTTMDMDATLQGFPLSDETIQTAFSEICGITLDDDVTLTLKSITSIRNEDEYGGYRLACVSRSPAPQTTQRSCIPKKVRLSTV